MNSVGLGNIPIASIPSPGTLDSGFDTDGASFSDILKNAVQTVDSLHDNAASQVQQLMQGER